MNRTVVDSSAVLALLKGEVGGAEAASLIAGGLISSVNACEVVGKLLDAAVPIEAAREALSLLSLTVVSFTEDVAYSAAELRGKTRSLGLSLGDHACLALAATEGCDVLTADRAWQALDIGVAIRLIR